MDIYTPLPITDKVTSTYKPTRLYIKELAGIFYFGKTTRDPYKYTGSGTIWLDRIKKYGKSQIKTVWVSDVYHDPHEIQEIALHFSKENQIVESAKWANISPETGLSGGMFTPESYIRRIETRIKNGTLNTTTPESRKKSVETKKRNGTSNPNTPDAIKKRNENMRKNGSIGRGAEKRNLTKSKNNTGLDSSIVREKSRQTMLLKHGVDNPQKIPYQCQHCNKIIHGKTMLNRYHNDNCKFKQ